MGGPRAAAAGDRPLGSGRLPFTYASHQAPVLAIKMRWPAAVDGTAMVMGSMAPDWAYALHGTAVAFDAHAGWGLVLVLRPGGGGGGDDPAPGGTGALLLPAQPAGAAVAPAAGAGGPRPRLPVSLVSGLVGALTHVVWDLFTHDGTGVPATSPGCGRRPSTVAGHSLTWAGLLQYASHVGGRPGERLPAQPGILRRARCCGGTASTPSTTHQRRQGRSRFWTVAAAGLVAGTAWAAMGEPGSPGPDHPRQPGRGRGTGGGLGRLRPR